MKRWFMVLGWPLIVLAACASPGGEERPYDGTDGPWGVYRVGAAVRDITPEEAALEAGRYCMGGYGILGIRDFDTLLTARATRLHDPLFARAMVIDLDGRSLALVAIDAAIMGNVIFRRMEDRVFEATGIDRDHVFIGLTHSHNALDLLGYMGGVPDEYLAFLVDQVAAAVAEADAAKEAATLHVSSGQGENRNRRGWDETDASIHVLDARRIADDTRIGTLINFGAHPTMIPARETMLSRDFCGYLVDAAQEQLGAPVLFVQGAVGDASVDETGLEYGEYPPTLEDRLRAYGERIALRAIESMAEQVEVGPEIHTDRRAYEVMISNDMLVALLVLQRGQIHLEYRYRFLQGLWVDTQVNYVRLGEQVQIVTLPGESLTRHTLAIKSAMQAPYRMALSMTTDSLIYLVPAEEWKRAPKGGDYEEMMCIDRFFADRTRDRAIEMIQLDPAYHGN